jgi:hypothetical protein
MTRIRSSTPGAATCAALLTLLALAVPAASAPPAPSATSAKTGAPRVLDWEALLPLDERESAGAGSPFVHDYLGEGGPAAMQQGSFKVNAELNGLRVKIPGYPVPLRVLEGRLVNEMFLVPYFGACIHVPPPPPNQIVYVKFAEPIKFNSIFEPVWITGTLSASTKNSSMGSAAYTLAADKVEKYEY